MKEDTEQAQQRKLDHIDLAERSQAAELAVDRRFYYEPLFGAHPQSSATWPCSLAGKSMNYPIWVSSMTGGTGKAGPINRHLAQVCSEFGLGMGLGSCRSLLDDQKYFDDFNLRPIIGKDLPLFANLGIAQIDQLRRELRLSRIQDLLGSLDVDGLVIHVNPLQEWFQEEGDSIFTPPIEIIESVVQRFDFPVIVKEVGQGFGPRSLSALLEMPLEAIEFGAYGGTNFSKLEALRRKTTMPSDQLDFIKIGHSAPEMMNFVSEIIASGVKPKCKSLIASGGVKTFLDGFDLVARSPMPALYGQASAMLQRAAISYEELKEFVEGQIQGLLLAKNLLDPRT